MEANNNKVKTTAERDLAYNPNHSNTYDHNKCICLFVSLTHSCNHLFNIEGWGPLYMYAFWEPPDHLKPFETAILDDLSKVTRKVKLL